MLNNISIKTRLLLLVSFMCLMILVIGAIAIIGMSKALRGIDEVYEGSVDAIENLNSIENKLNQDALIPMQRLHREEITSNDAESHLKEWLAATQILDKYIKSFATQAAYVQKANELQELMKKFNESVNRFLDYIKKDDKTQITNYLTQELYVLTDPIARKIDLMIEMHVRETQTDYTQAAEEVQRAIKEMILSLVGTILICILLAFWISKSIVKPLKEAVTTLDQVALGDTSMQIEVIGKDESSKLMKAMKNMVETTSKMTSLLMDISNGDLTISVPIRSQNDTFGKSLNSMIETTSKMTSLLGDVSNGDLTVSVPVRSQNDTFGKALNTMIERLKQNISEIQSEVNILSHSTQEIVASVNQVSTGTAETASAVAETTTTVEELKQTAHISADKAKDVLTNAEETLKIVKNSEKTLQLTIEEMNQIQEKMRIISESIIKLSEHSLTIGEIINTVNNLAEQSNLLAVNAAIEAAKAGDQGKSFGVVAQEIRTLAEQSKEATVQVRSILNDIQNATSAAVLATEQGSKAVSKGVAQSSQMSESIHTLSTSISRVAQAANQITISSQQQLVGVDQVTVAMTNINQASTQHVEHMHQIEDAIGTLNDVAISLHGLVNQYKIAQSNIAEQKDESLDNKINTRVFSLN